MFHWIGRRRWAMSYSTHISLCRENVSDKDSIDEQFWRARNERTCAFAVWPCVADLWTKTNAAPCRIRHYSDDASRLRSASSSGKTYCCGSTTWPHCARARSPRREHRRRTDSVVARTSLTFVCVLSSRSRTTSVAFESGCPSSS